MAIGSPIDGRDVVLRDRLRSLSDLPLLSDGEELVAAATIADGREALLQSTAGTAATARQTSSPQSGR